MKNKLSDLNDHLFAQLERLTDEDLQGEKLEREIKRGEAVVGVADAIIRNAGVQVVVAKILVERGRDPMAALRVLEGRPLLLENGSEGKVK